MKMGFQPEGTSQYFLGKFFGNRVVRAAGSSAATGLGSESTPILVVVPLSAAPPGKIPLLPYRYTLYKDHRSPWLVLRNAYPCDYRESEFHIYKFP